MEQTPRSVLREVFGFEDFRPMQESVIETVLAGKDVLAVMPTGGGKSLCYQVPALLLGGLSLVVSPLIALMRDQVAFLREYGVEAFVLNSSLSPEEWRANAAAARAAAGRSEGAALLYVAPETLASPRMRDALSGLRLSLLAVDEAHCISEWGHDFRPEYRALGALRAELPPSPCLALTATATERVRAEIMAELGFDEPREFVAGFDRPNIFLAARRRAKVLDQIAALAADYPEQSGIVYCFSRARAESIAGGLADLGISALPYHAGLPAEVRSANQDAFIDGEVRVIAATTAFGMGIDKPDIRFVVHADLPKSIEQYYQEIGRAGRDGLPARALLLYSPADAMKIRALLADSHNAYSGSAGDDGADGDANGAERANQALAAETSLRAMMGYAEATSCRRAILLSWFGDTVARAGDGARAGDTGGVMGASGTTGCGACDVCTGTSESGGEEADLTTEAWKLLSCVKRTGERYGAGHVIDVLTGSRNERVLGLGHAELSTWGIGKEWTKAQWSDLCRQLVIKGYLDKDPEYGVLSLTSLAYASFRDRVPIRAVPLPAARTGRKGQGRAGGPGYPGTVPGGAAGTSSLDLVLESKLRALRKRLAGDAGVPPYVIFSDRSLFDLVAKKPRSREELLEVFGFGKVKTERLGDEILAEIIGV